MIIRFNTLRRQSKYAPGGSFVLGPQTYRVLRYVDHWKRDGQYVQMLAYSTTCAECGRSFEARATKDRLRKKQVNRRCKLHHRTGVPVPRDVPRKSKHRRPAKRPRAAAERRPAVKAPPLAPGGSAGPVVPRPSFLD